MKSRFETVEQGRTCLLLYPYIHKVDARPCSLSYQGAYIIFVI